jgi:ribosomal protein L11 methyltransferase
MNNPFNQNISNWQFTITCLKSEQYKIIEAIDEFAESYTIFEIDDITALITVFTNTESQAEYFTAELNNLNEVYKISTPTQVEDKDWVSETQINFKPIDIGNFYIHSSYYKPTSGLNSKIAIEIDPGRAFGTGEHATTKMCLLAISELNLAKNALALDLGCGSAVLAIAVKKKFDCEVIASDIDDIAVGVAHNNCIINNEPNIKTVVSNGFLNEELQVKFDLIVANILANPLIELSTDINNQIKPEGHIILSGFTTTQQQEVIDSYLANKFIHLKTYEQNDWVSVLMQKL